MATHKEIREKAAQRKAQEARLKEEQEKAMAEVEVIIKEIAERRNVPTDDGLLKLTEKKIEEGFSGDYSGLGHLVLLLSGVSQEADRAQDYMKANNYDFDHQSNVAVRYSNAMTGLANEINERERRYTKPQKYARDPRLETY